MMEYTKERVSADITVEEYLRDYVNVEEFLEYCKECPNYGKVWSCPPYDFDPVDYWKSFDRLHIEGVVLHLSRELCEKEYEKEEALKLSGQILKKEKELLAQELYSMEDKNSRSLSAGCCNLCESCRRKDDMPCISPDMMRYSIESIGGNVGLTCTKLLGQELLWCTEGRLPERLTLISGLLIKD